MNSKVNVYLLWPVLFAAATFWMTASSADAQNLYVSNGHSTTVGEYNSATGATINASFVTGLVQPRGVLVAGNALYVADDGTNTIKAYNATTGAALPGFTTISALSDPEKMVVSGNTLFVVNYSSGTVGEYNASTGAVINASFVTGLSDTYGMSVEGNTLYVDDYGETRINEYNATTGAISPNYILAFGSIYDIAVTGSVLYAANGNNGGEIDEFNLLANGAASPTPLITGLGSLPRGLAIVGDNLYVSQADKGTVGEYNALTGATINASLITGLNYPTFLTVVPEPSTYTLLVGGAGFLGWAYRRRVRRA